MSRETTPGESRPATPPAMPPGLTPVRRLGGSPLSEVFLVVDGEGRRHALKVLRGSAARDPRLQERWRREAVLLQEIRHPNLVRCHASLEVEGRPALLLDYVDGPSLRERLRKGPLGWEEAARIGVQVAQALERLHRHGALHRDVKPHNILLDTTRGAVLADLGLVRRREDPTLTRPGAALGSPAYMSPEQAWDPSDLGPEADVYSLGATLHHALSGAPPFQGSGVGEVIHRVLHTDPDDLPAEVPDALRRVVRVAMAKHVDARYGRARDLARDLGRVLLGMQPLLVTQARLRRRRRLLGAAAVSAVLLAAGATLRPDRAVAAWLTASSGRLEASAAAGEPRSGPVPPATPPSPAAGPVLEGGPGESHEAGDRPMPLWERHLADGRLRAAWEVVAYLEEVEPGPRWEEARARILAEAESVATRAESLLGQHLGTARVLLDTGALDPSSWADEVLRSWRAAGLPVADLPLRPGGSDPLGRLAAARARLEQDLDLRLSEQAASRVPERRRRTAELLRQGLFPAARDLWNDSAVDSRVLRFSPAGRWERFRAQELASLAERLQARLAEQVGRPVRLQGRDGVLAGVLEAMPREQGFRVRPADGPARQVGLLDLDPLALADLLGRPPGPGLAWLQAQLLWCQGRLRAAIDRIEGVDPGSLPSEYAPAFWIEEWRGESEAVAPPPAAPSPPAQRDATDPAAALAALWRRAHPEGEVGVVDGGVEIRWRDLDWHPEWRVSLRRDRHRWRLAAWRVTWRLPAALPPPEQVGWLGRVFFRKPGRRAMAVTQVGDTQVEAIGVIPGSRQTLEWREGLVYLDGDPIGPLGPDRSSDRLLLEGRASERFPVLEVTVRVEPMP